MKKLSPLYTRPDLRVLLLQMGEERSIVKFLGRGYITKPLLINNKELMEYDENGLVENAVVMS